MSEDLNATVDGAGTNAPVDIINAPADTGNDLSVSAAARALAAARHAKTNPPAESAEPATAEHELAQANTDPVEEPAPSEDATEADPAELPPIDPPRSWTKEAKERFESLPRDTQEYLAAREQERDRELRRSQNEAAEIRKAIQAEREQTEQVRKQYEAKLPELLQTLQDVQAGQFSDIRTMADVERLVNEDPFRYNQWQVHQQKLAAIAGETQRINQETERKRQSEWAEHVNRENVLFADMVPEAADKAKFEALATRAANDLLPGLGFKPEELNALANGHEKLSIYDHRVQRLIFDSLKLADIEKAKTTAISKPLPPVQRPGVSRPAGAAASEAIQALTRKAHESGSLKDMQELRAAQLAARARRAS